MIWVLFYWVIWDGQQGVFWGESGPGAQIPTGCTPSREARRLRSRVLAALSGQGQCLSYEGADKVLLHVIEARFI